MFSGCHGTGRILKLQEMPIAWLTFPSRSPEALADAVSTDEKGQLTEEQIWAGALEVPQARKARMGARSRKAAGTELASEVCVCVFTHVCTGKGWGILPFLYHGPY